ncbi:MAG: hypothetical protein AAFQ89_01490 [Cyanobacteria bacterium J06626_18]
MNNRAALIAGILGLGVALPAVAHKVEVQDDIGATLHIEPDDIPKAGAPSDLWFALTKVGGVVIPLEDCDCTLTVYDGSDTAIASPSLRPVSAEGYADIPGSSVTFPEVGAYELVLAGAPLGDVQFSPFELRFDVTVAAQAAGIAPANDAATEVAESDSEAAAVPAETLPNAEQPTTDLATETAPVASAETPRQTASSFPLGGVALVGGGVLAAGIAWGVMRGSKPSGGKSE